mgnify:CR=1 FL=1
MVEVSSPKWLILDGYEDEPAAFGVPPYVGFHIRYLCGVLEQAKIDYEYITIDQWRDLIRTNGEDWAGKRLSNIEGFACIAGAVVPGRYLRGTPLSLKETRNIIRELPSEIPALFGGVGHSWMETTRMGASKKKSLFSSTRYRRHTPHIPTDWSMETHTP